MVQNGRSRSKSNEKHCSIAMFTLKEKPPPPHPPIPHFTHVVRWAFLPYNQAGCLDGCEDGASAQLEHRPAQRHSVIGFLAECVIMGILASMKEGRFYTLSSAPQLYSLYPKSSKQGYYQ